MTTPNILLNSLCCFPSFLKEITSPSNLEVVKSLPQEALVSLNDPVPTLRKTMDRTIALNKYLRLILMKLRKS